MPILPSFIERMLFVSLNQGPAPMLDIFSAIGFRTVLAAVNLGVFDALAGGPLTPAELAQRINADERGVKVLLEALEALLYVKRSDDGRYANTPVASKWMVSTAQANFAPAYGYWGATFTHLWNNLEESIRSGQAPVNLYEWLEHQPKVSDDFQTYLIALARVTAGEIVGKLNFPSAHRLLDIGGGHAEYSIAMCRRYPGLSAVVFDSPQPLVTARQHIAAEKMEDRVSVQAGDILKDDLGSGYDVALLFNIIHGFTPDENTAMLKKTASALNPGGVAAIIEQLDGKASGPTSAAASHLLSLSYFHLLGGRTYTYEAVVSWLNAAGFAQTRRINLLRAAGSSIILGTKPG